MSIPANIYESEYLNYTKLFYESQIKQLKRVSFLNNTSDRSNEQIALLETESKVAGTNSRNIANLYRESNTKFFETIDFQSRMDLMKFFKLSNNEFVSKYSDLLTMDEYIKLLDIEIEEGDH